MTDLDVYYDKSLSLPEWISRWEEGTVPGRWPYSLDLMAGHGYRVRQPTRTSAEYAIGFDESVSPRIYRSGAPGICGTIWMTDDLLQSRPTIRRAARRFYLSRYLRRMSLLLTFSSATPKLLAELLGIPSSRVTYIPLGIDTEFYPLTEYKPSSLILSVGNDRSRDIDTLYRAYEIVLRVCPSAEIVVQTSDPRPAPPGVTRVHRFRDHAQLRSEYQRSAVVVVASSPNLYTSGSTVALEAQAIGRPVVITDTPGMSDYVRDGESGYLVPARDPKMLADRILNVLRDPQKGELFGKAGASRVRSENSAEQMIASIASALDSVRAARQTGR